MHTTSNDKLLNKLCFVPGCQSPANTGDRNEFNYGEPPPPKEQKTPK